MAIGSSQYAFGLFVEPLHDEFGWNRTQITASLSFTAIGSLLSPFIGRLMDQHGARRIIFVCIALVGSSFVLRPFMSELWHWYALSFLQFVGFQGASALPAGRLVGIWFSKTRGRVMGIAAMGNNFGGLVVPPIVAAVITLTSWRGGYIALAVMALFVLIVAIFLIKEFPSASDLARRDGVKTGPARSDDSRPALVLTGWTVREALRTRAFYAITVAVLLGTFTYSTILPQITAHLTSNDVSPTAAALALSGVAVMGMGGKLTLGFLAERITTRFTLMIDLLAQAAILTLMVLAPTQTIMIVSVPLFGFFMGGFGALFQLIVQETFGVRYFGSIMGLVSMTTIVSFGVGPILAGASFDRTDSYQFAFLTVAVLFALGASCLTLANKPSRSEAETAVAG